jgi:hypothetical protein
VLYSGVISHPNERRPMDTNRFQVEITYINAFEQDTTVVRSFEEMAAFTYYLTRSFFAHQLVSIEFTSI